MLTGIKMFRASLPLLDPGFPVPHLAANFPAPLADAAIAVQADTVFAAPLRDGFDVVVAVAAGLIGATFLAVLLTFLFLLLMTRKLVKGLEEARKRVAEDPGLKHLRNTAANVEEISTALKDEVGKLRASVSLLSDRLEQASDRMEERIDEFNALMEVVQSEAEDVFVDTASTARGVRRGLGHLGDGRRRSERAQPRRPGGGAMARPAPATRTPPAGDPLRSTALSPEEDDQR